MLNYSYKTHARKSQKYGIWTRIAYNTTKLISPYKIRHSFWKLSQELKWKISFLPYYTHAKMACRKRERYKIEPRILVPLCWNWNMKTRSLKLLMIKEICFWLPPGLDGRKVCSQEHISLIINSFWWFCFHIPIPA